MILDIGCVNVQFVSGDEMLNLVKNWVVTYCVGLNYLQRGETYALYVYSMEFVYLFKWLGSVYK